MASNTTNTSEQGELGESNFLEPHVWGQPLFDDLQNNHMDIKSSAYHCTSRVHITVEIPNALQTASKLWENDEVLQLFSRSYPRNCSLKVRGATRE